MNTMKTIDELIAEARVQRDAELEAASSRALKDVYSALHRVFGEFVADQVEPHRFPSGAIVAAVDGWAFRYFTPEPRVNGPLEAARLEVAVGAGRGQPYWKRVDSAADLIDETPSMIEPPATRPRSLLESIQIPRGGSVVTMPPLTSTPLPPGAADPMVPRCVVRTAAAPINRASDRPRPVAGHPLFS